ncbi:hypothetical protein [Brevundimonas fluminis]|uniref:hypothetical protein n=1 Tax=Brevundimonas fluminis TaxID=2487274 RepID=UPI000F65850B|nr:hypothetical protein [Brevundimonas fluminis]
MRPYVPICLAALAIFGCGEPPSSPPDAAGAMPATAPRAHDGPDAPSPPAPASPILQPLFRADWEDRLEPGAGCNLSRDGQNLVVIVLGDGVARIDGAVVDLTGVPTDFDAMTRPGRYSGGGAVVVLTPDPERGEGEALDETFTRPVRVEATSGGRRERFDASWTCGA